MVKPLLRWAGGKQWIAGELTKLIPQDIGTYYEPFLGGGSLFFEALPKAAILSDVNDRLVETYRVIRSDPVAVVAVLENWSNEKRDYYKVRRIEFTDTVHRVAQFIYLNRTCWNGLYRVNKQGQFNVPFANHGRPVFDECHLLEVSAALERAELQCGDFDQVLIRAKPKDFVYLDPPYVSASADKGFAKYNVKVFSWRDQQRLGQTAAALADKGCYVLVSNMNREDVIKLYPGFSYRKVSRHSILAASAEFRGVTTELLLVSDPLLFQSLDG